MLLSELAAQLGVSPANVRKLMRQGLPCIKHNNRWHFDEGKVLAWLLDRDLVEPEQPPPDETPSVNGTHVVKTQNELANALGIDLRRVQYWCKEPGFPGRIGDPKAGRPDGYFPVEEIRHWIAQHHPNSRAAKALHAGGGGETEAVKLQRARRKRAEFEYEKERGKYVTVDEVQRFYLRTIAYVRQQVVQLVDEVRGALEEYDTKTRGAVVDIAQGCANRCLEGIQELIAGDQDEQQDAPDN